MDRGSLSLSLCAVIACLLAAPHGSSADKNNCSCAEIPEVPLTKPPPQTCSDTFRYTCADGYVRKVGMSNRIKCTRSGNSAPKWDKPKLQCIRDPHIKTTTCPPVSPVTTTYRTTSASSNQPTSNNTGNHHRSIYDEQRLGTTATALIVCASLVITGALMGISYTCYRRRARNNALPVTDEEKMPMSNVPARPASEGL